jgi:tetratricopeptide (TPR) repeat protein
MVIQGLLTLVTFGFYFPWAFSNFLKWKAANTLVGDKPGQFTGTGGSLFFFYLIHLMILPLLTLGLYYFWALYRLYAWKEEHTKYGGEKTSFGAGFGGFLKVSLVGYILNTVTLNLFTSWSMCMLFRWQINGLAVGNEEQVEHFPPVKTNMVAVALLIIIGLIPFAAVAIPIISQLRNFQNMQSQVARMNLEALKTKKAVTRPIGKRTPRIPKNPVKKLAAKAPTKPAMRSSMPFTGEKPIPKKDLNDEIEMQKLNNLIDRENQNADAYYNRGLLYANKGNLQVAEKDYSKAIEIDRRYEDAYYNRGLVFAKMKKYEQAVRDFAQAITLKPNAVDAYCNRGNSNFQLGNLDLALDDFNAALKINPNDADIYYNRAVVYLAKEAKSKAMVDFQKAAKLGHNKARKYLKMPPSKPEKSAIPLKTSNISRGMDLKNIKISASTASGKIHGKNFKVENAKVENGILTLRQGKDFFPDLAVTIFLFLKKDENIEGKTFNISKDHGFGAPHIHMKWKPENKNIPETKIFMKNYVMRLEFGKKEGNSLPGKIYLSLPDEFQSSIAGTFTSEVREK